VEIYHIKKEAKHVDKEQIKLYLKENPQDIKEILENLGCHHVKISSKRVTGALPNGDNKTSVSIKLNDFLSSEIYSKKGDFENKYEIKDIFSVIQYISECNLPEAIQYICIQCGFKYSNNVKKSTKSNSYSFLKRFKRSILSENGIYEENILNEDIIERFIRCECKLFSDDRIDGITQEKFGVCYDILDNRVVFPIRNDKGQLLTFKGRTMELNHKIRGIPKYIYYYPFFGEYYLFGLYENYFDILSATEIYVGESEKFVMQLDSMEINNCVGISKKSISPIQLNKLLKLGKDIVLTFDKDVTLEEIFIECRKFKGLCNVYYIYDTLDLLKGKQSPSDQGRNVFMQLVNECKFKYKGE
jgi:DNA primase